MLVTNAKIQFLTSYGVVAEIELEGEYDLSSSIHIKSICLDVEENLIPQAIMALEKHG